VDDLGKENRMKKYYLVFFAAILAGKTCFAEADVKSDSSILVATNFLPKKQSVSIDADGFVCLTMCSVDEIENEGKKKDEKKDFGAEEKPQDEKSKEVVKVKSHITAGFIFGGNMTFLFDTKTDRFKVGAMLKYDCLVLEGVHSLLCLPYFAAAYSVDKKSKHEIMMFFGGFTEIGAQYRYRFDSGLSVFGRTSIGKLGEKMSVNLSAGAGYKVV